MFLMFEKFEEAKWTLIYPKNILGKEECNSINWIFGHSGCSSNSYIQLYGRGKFPTMVLIVFMIRILQLAWELEHFYSYWLVNFL